VLDENDLTQANGELVACGWLFEALPNPYGLGARGSETIPARAAALARSRRASSSSLRQRESARGLPRPRRAPRRSRWIEPFAGFDDIPRHAMPLVIEQTESILREAVALLRGAATPHPGFGIILRDAASGYKHEIETGLRGPRLGYAGLFATEGGGGIRNSPGLRRGTA
jgi:hypothetical protein